jgi:hypothetical protein
MSKELLTETQINAINGMTDQVRYNHLISQAKKNDTMWTLGDTNGVLLIDTGDEKCIVLFSHEQMAEQWAAIDHPECKAMGVELQPFIEKWVPGMVKDNFFVALQPNLDGEGFVESAEEFALNFATE